MAERDRVIEGRAFDTPLVLPGTGNVEPQSYIAEKPYELTKYEFKVLGRRGVSGVLFPSAVSATIGMAIMLAGKFIAGVMTKQPADLQKWEMWALVIGLAVSVIGRFIRSDDEKEREQLENVIDSHFQSNKPRRVHVAAGATHEA